jgi:hypothetical protein
MYMGIPEFKINAEKTDRSFERVHFVLWQGIKMAPKFKTLSPANIARKTLQKRFLIDFFCFSQEFVCSQGDQMSCKKSPKM